MDDTEEIYQVWNNAVDDILAEMQEKSLPGMVIAASPSFLQREDIMDVVFSSRQIYVVRLKKGRNRIYIAANKELLSKEELQCILRREGIDETNVKKIS